MIALLCKVSLTSGDQLKWRAGVNGRPGGFRKYYLIRVVIRRVGRSRLTVAHGVVGHTTSQGWIIRCYT